MNLSRHKKIDCIRRMAIGTVFYAPIVLSVFMGSGWAQVSSIDLPPVSKWSFAPQSLTPSNETVGVVSAAGQGSHSIQASPLIFQKHKSLFPEGEVFSRKQAGNTFETASIMSFSTLSTKSALPGKQVVLPIAQDGHGGSPGQKELTSGSADASRSLPLHPLLQDVLSASLDYERLKNKTLLLDVLRGGRAGQISGRSTDTKLSEAEEGILGNNKILKTSAAPFLTLDSALNSARRRSPQIKGARSAQTASYYNSLVTLGGYGPKVDFRNSRGRESSNNGLSTPAVSYPDHERVDKTFTLRQPIFDLNIMAGYKRDLVNEELAGIGRDVTEDQITQEVVTVYFDLIQSLIGVSLADEFQGRLQELMTYISNRAEGGAVSDVELQRVQAASLAAERIKFESLSARDIAVTALDRLVGEMPGQIAFPVRSVAAMPKDI